MFVTHLVKLKTLALAAIVLCGPAINPLTAMAAPVEVSYTVAGSAGDWALDFSFTNNMSLAQASADMSLYYLGVSIDGGISPSSVVGSPAGYSTSFGGSPLQPINLALNGGSNTIINNLWINSTISSLTPGTTLSGFLVHVTDLMAPTSVSWFAEASSRTGGTYTGGGYFESNIAKTQFMFEGAAQVQPVPLPAAVVLFGSGLVGLVGWQRKRLRKTV